MHWYNYITLICWPILAISTLFQRRWLLAACFTCFTAFQVFDKCFPAVLPAGGPELFAFAGVCLVVLENVRGRRRKAPPAAST